MTRKKYKVVKVEVFDCPWDNYCSWSDEEVLGTFPSKEKAMQYISELKLDYDIDGKELIIYGNKVSDYSTDYGRYIRYEDDNDLSNLKIILSVKGMEQQSVSFLFVRRIFYE